MCQSFRLHGLHTTLDDNPDIVLPGLIAARLGLSAAELSRVRVARRSIDARHRPVQVIYSVDFELSDKSKIDITGLLESPIPVPLEVRPGQKPLPEPPVVVGAGPAGLFAALLLAEHGFQPILLERGGAIAERKKALERFGKYREPEPECNALFGLGGAGTFSDGKLKTGLNHPWLAEVLRIFVSCGAPNHILIDAKPHIGTDVLGRVVDALVRRIVDAGGAVHTNARVNALHRAEERLTGLSTSKGFITTSVVILAVGHSALDTWRMLGQAGLELVPKKFQMGIRVEHPQRWLDDRRYGSYAGHPSLGAADYKLACRMDDRPVFSFCMCPGGETIPTVNEAGHLVINGMSNSARDSEFASSGLVVTLRPEEIAAGDIASCLAYRKMLERRCFVAGGSDYRAPAQRLIDFADDRFGSPALPASSYRLGTKSVRLSAVLPFELASPLRRALNQFDKKLRGYLHPEAVAIAPESRASSPVRILRDRDSLECTRLRGVYPAGEGAGYAGGIMSSALDGLNAARKIIENYAPFA